MRSLQQYDRGVVISIPVRDEDGTALTLDGTETAVLLVESPTGRRKSLDATVDVPAQAVRAVTAAMDFDEWGTWRVQAKVTTDDYEVRGRATPMMVYSNVDMPHHVITLGTASFYLTTAPLTAS